MKRRVKLMDTAVARGLNAANAQVLAIFEACHRAGIFPNAETCHAMLRGAVMIALKNATDSKEAAAWLRTSLEVAIAEVEAISNQERGEG